MYWPYLPFEAERDERYAIPLSPVFTPNSAARAVQRARHLPNPGLACRVLPRPAQLFTVVSTTTDRGDDDVNSLDPMSVLLPGQGAQSRDRRSVADDGLRARLARVVVPAVRWTI